MLEWNVLIGDFNSGEICEYNILGYISRDDKLKKALKKCNDKESFCEKIRSDLMYHYWSKTEWEVVVSHWPPSDNKRFRSKKIDAYSQVMLNWDRVADYIWEHRKEI